MSNTERNPLDVWLRFADGHCDCAGDCADDEAEYEANTYRNEDGTFDVEWYHNDVGQVSTREFPTYAAATAWLESEGFQDFSS